MNVCSRRWSSCGRDLGSLPLDSCECGGEHFNGIHFRFSNGWRGENFFLSSFERFSPQKHINSNEWWICGTSFWLFPSTHAASKMSPYVFRCGGCWVARTFPSVWRCSIEIWTVLWQNSWGLVVWDKFDMSVTYFLSWSKHLRVERCLVVELGINAIFDQFIIVENDVIGHLGLLKLLLVQVFCSFWRTRRTIPKNTRHWLVY